MKWVDGARTRLRLLFAGRAAESRMKREFEFHIEMATEQLMREERLAYVEARRRALAMFGGVEMHKEALRDGRGLAWFRGWSLNVKLGARMSVRYPGVTIVGVLAMAIGIGLGAAYLEALNDFLRPTLPFDEGERIVGLRNWDIAENRPELRAGRDFLVWKAQLSSVEHLGAFRSVEVNLGPSSGPLEPAYGAEISASAFEVARVPSLLGRTLTASDERPGAPAVIVIGFNLWQKRFSSDRDIVGQGIRLGETISVVVGVMPEGFAFPVSHHFWVPLSSARLPAAGRQGPAIQIFGRLAPGLSLDDAQSQLGAIGARASTELAATHEHLRPRVMRYTDLFVGDDDNWQAYFVELFFVLLLLILGSNVATMVFARTATREHEIAMRFALGASRSQILIQFFAEALVLALAATVIGLGAVAWGGQLVSRFFWEVTEGRAPFWLDDRINPTTVAFACALAMVVSVVAGVLPAFKATSAGTRARLRHSASGDSALRFGGLWSAVIVVQVVFTVLVLPPAMVASRSLTLPDHTDPGFPAEEYLSARIAMNGSFARFKEAVDELRRQLTIEPGISRVTFASRLPGMAHPEAWVDVDSEGTSPAPSGELAMATAVDVDFFRAFDAGITAGRGFTSSDLSSASRVVVVNGHFVNEILQGRNAVGRRIRYSTRYSEREQTGVPDGLPRAAMREPGAWYEIVGVVKNIGMDTTRDAFASGEGPGVYHPLAAAAMGADAAYAVRVAFHVGSDASAFAPRLSQLAYAINPGMRLDDLLRLDGPIDRVSRAQRRIGRVMSSATALVALIALLISIAGTYSVMSFTVARHTREIGIRIALGADRRRIIAGVFSRVIVQIGAGVVVGAFLWFYVFVYQLGGDRHIGLFAASAVILALVGIAACGLPVRRALRIEPTEALRQLG